MSWWVILVVSTAWPGTDPAGSFSRPAGTRPVGLFILNTKVADPDPDPGPERKKICGSRPNFDTVPDPGKKEFSTRKILKNVFKNRLFPKLYDNKKLNSCFSLNKPGLFSKKEEKICVYRKLLNYHFSINIHAK